VSLKGVSALLGWALMGSMALGVGACPGELANEDPCHWISEDVDHPLCPNWLKDLDATSDSAAADTQLDSVSEVGADTISTPDSSSGTDDATAADAGDDDVVTADVISDTEPSDDADSAIEADAGGADVAPDAGEEEDASADEPQ